MRLSYHQDIVYLDAMPLDVGYAASRVEVVTLEGTSLLVGGQKPFTQLLISIPFMDAITCQALSEMALILKNTPSIEATLTLIAHDAAVFKDAALNGFTLCVDALGEFGMEYSTRIATPPLKGALTKALFVITKDGALFYNELVTNLVLPFDTQKALLKLATAQSCYTGQGCHV